jgi:hypothetical protein
MVTAKGPVPSAVACGRGVAAACPSLSTRTSIVGDPASQRRSVIPRRSITLPHTPSGSSRGLTLVALSRSLTAPSRFLALPHPLSLLTFVTLSHARFLE